MLTRNEKMLIADALNGTMIGDDLGMMCGEDGALADAAVIGTDAQGRVLLTGSMVCSGLELELYDSMRLNEIDVKWEVDGAALLGKVRAMPRADKEKLLRRVQEVWLRLDENFECDLVALEV